MEQRTQQFVTDAQRPRDAKTQKDIAKLRSFLFKNQECRFTDSEQQRLFQATQLYVSMFSSGPTELDCPALQLVEDALKMPFTVFTTSQKKTMLKWLDKLNGQEAAAAADGGPAAAAAEPWTLLDLTQTTAEVMNEEGDTQQIELSVCDTELVQQLRKVFECEDEVCVELGVRHGKPAIVRLVGG